MKMMKTNKAFSLPEVMVVVAIVSVVLAIILSSVISVGSLGIIQCGEYRYGFKELRQEKNIYYYIDSYGHKAQAPVERCVVTYYK